jgi:hypothetical protein
MSYRIVPKNLATAVRVQANALTSQGKLKPETTCLSDYLKQLTARRKLSR